MPAVACVEIDSKTNTPFKGGHSSPKDILPARESNITHKIFVELHESVDVADGAFVFERVDTRQDRGVKPGRGSNSTATQHCGSEHCWRFCFLTCRETGEETFVRDVPDASPSTPTPDHAYLCAKPQIW